MGLSFDLGGFAERQPEGADSSAAPVEEWRLERRRLERIAEGSLACPACDLPIALGERVAAGEGLDCPYCGRAAPAREYLRLGAGAPEASRIAVVASF